MFLESVIEAPEHQSNVPYYIFHLYSIPTDCQKDRVTFIPISDDTTNEVQRVDICQRDTLTNGVLNVDSNYVIVEFVSDGSVQRRGFVFSYQAFKGAGEFSRFSYRR